MLPRMHGLWPRDYAGGSRAGSHPRIPTAEPPPQKAGPHWEARRVHVKGGCVSSAVIPFGNRLARRDLARRAAGTGRQPWGTGAKEGSPRPPPIGHRGSRGDPGIADRHVPTAPNPPGVRAGSHGPPFAGVLPAALTRRHPCTNYTRLRRRATANGRPEVAGRLLAREPPPLEGRLAGRQRPGRRCGLLRGRTRRSSHALASAGACHVRPRVLNTDLSFQHLVVVLHHEHFSPVHLAAARCG